MEDVSFIALLRGLQDVALLILFGSAVFGLAIGPALRTADVELTQVSGVPGSLIRIGAAAALVLGAAWLAGVTASVAETDNVADLAAALPVVALKTQFGHWIGVRLLLLIAALLITRWRIPLVLATGAALVVQPKLGHAGAMVGSKGLWLSVIEVFHVLAAGAWFGGLLPLWLVLRRLPASASANILQRFSHLGIGCVAVLAISGVATAWMTVGSLGLLVTTLYGQLILVKLGLFALALILASLNREVLTPMLGKRAESTVGLSDLQTLRGVSLRNAPQARRGLLWSVGTEACLVTFIVVTAGLLASVPPASHQQPFLGAEHEHQH